MKFTKWFPMLASTLMLTTVVGCSTGGEDQPAASALPVVEDNSPVTIQYWHSHADVQMPAVNNMIAEFQKKYPNITVEPVFQGAYVDLHKKLQAAVAAKEVPAVTNVEVSVLPNFADGGVFADLTPYITRDKV